MARRAHYKRIRTVAIIDGSVASFSTAFTAAIIIVPLFLLAD